MTQRLVLPRGATEMFGGLFPRCDDPPTTALVLDAAPDVGNASSNKEERADGESR
jgi:hypothetical protein